MQPHLTIFSSRRRETSQALRDCVRGRRGSKTRYALGIRTGH
jgi:hypothetical protein